MSLSKEKKKKKNKNTKTRVTTMDPFYFHSPKNEGTQEL
jgi:hypothetical protein